MEEDNSTAGEERLVHMHGQINSNRGIRRFGLRNFDGQLETDLEAAGGRIDRKTGRIVAIDPDEIGKRGSSKQ